MPDTAGAIYRLTFASGKAYIGLTTQHPNRRYRQHRRAMERGSTSPVYQAWHKHGAPTLDVLAIVERHELRATEVRAIAVFRTLKPNGYNLSPGGDVPPVWLPGVPAKISAANKGRRHSPEVNARRGRAVVKALADPAVRAKMSAAGKGHAVAEDTRAKISAANTGKVRTAETRAKLKLARNTRPPASLETRAKMRAARLGKTLTDSAKAKVSAARKAAATKKEPTP